MLPPPEVPLTPALEEPSSYVSTTVAPFASIGATLALSHASPVEIGQSCSSLHRFGAMKLTFGIACTSNCVYGSTCEQVAVLVKTDANGVAGLCLSAYSPDV